MLGADGGSLTCFISLMWLSADGPRWLKRPEGLRPVGGRRKGVHKGDGSVEVLEKLLELVRGLLAQLRSTVRGLFIDSNPYSAQPATGVRAPFACLT